MRSEAVTWSPLGQLVVGASPGVLLALHPAAGADGVKSPRVKVWKFRRDSEPPPSGSDPSWANFKQSGAGGNRFNSKVPIRP